MIALFVLTGLGFLAAFACLLGASYEYEQAVDRTRCHVQRRPRLYDWAAE